MKRHKSISHMLRNRDLSFWTPVNFEVEYFINEETEGVLTDTVITSERAQRAERVLSYLREKSKYSRPDPTRPDPITLFKALYLGNRMSDRQAVFFDEYHLDVKVVWHGYHTASVPDMARGACQSWGTLDDPQNTTSITGQRLDRLG